MWRKKPMLACGTCARIIAGKQHQLIVMDPDQVTVAILAQDCVGEPRVDLAIGIPPGCVERDTVDEVMKERP